MAGLVIAWWLASGLPINFIDLHERLRMHACVACVRPRPTSMHACMHASGGPEHHACARLTCMYACMRTVGPCARFGGFATF